MHGQKIKKIHVTKIQLEAGSAKFTKAVGMDADLEVFGLGVRSKRYSMLIENYCN